MYEVSRWQWQEDHSRQKTYQPEQFRCQALRTEGTILPARPSTKSICSSSRCNRSLQTKYRTHLWCPGPWLNPTSREQVPIRFLTSLWHSFLVSPASSYWLSESTILSRDPWDNCRSKGCMKSTDGLQGQWLLRLINITPIDSALFIKYSVSFLWV